MRSEANRESKDVSKLGMVTSRVGEVRLYIETKSFRAWAWLATCGISFTPIPFLPVTSAESCERMGFYEVLEAQRQCVRFEVHLIQN